jgi:prolipoprotein diacylglyceryltransferase
VNAFSVWVGLGAAVGLWRLAHSAPKQQAMVWVNTGLFVLCFTLAGARLSYVWLNWGYFASHLIEIPLLWLGGLTWPGAVGGTALGLIFLAFQYQSSRSQAHQPAHIPLGWLGDRLYPLLPPLAITAWVGCWQIGVAYGKVAPAGALWGVPCLDETGIYRLRFPLQPLAALALLAYFALLETRLKTLRPAGLLSGLAVTGLLLNLLAASLLRADPSPYWYGMHLDTLMAVGYLALFLSFVIINSLVLRIRRRKPFSNLKQTHS